MKTLQVALVSILVFFLSSCGGGALQLGGLNAINRTPPTSAITLHRDLVSQYLGATVTYPGGRYTPAHQDDSGTFYLAPNRPFGYDTVLKSRREIPDAGFYLRDDQKNGLHIWDRGGEMVFKRPVSKLKTVDPPSFDLVP